MGRGGKASWKWCLKMNERKEGSWVGEGGKASWKLCIKMNERKERSGVGGWEQGVMERVHQNE